MKAEIMSYKTQLGRKGLDSSLSGAELLPESLPSFASKNSLRPLFPIIGDVQLICGLLWINS